MCILLNNVGYKKMNTNYICVVMVITWTPFILALIWASLGMIFFTMEQIGKYGLKFLEYISKSIENYFMYKGNLIKRYIKFASIISFIVLAIMLLARFSIIDIE